MPAPRVAGAAPPLHCAVASPHALATQAARDVIRSGGNAIDAALTAAVVLTLVHPPRAAVGGALIALVREVDGPMPCVNSSGPASRNIDPAAYRSRYGTVMPVT